LRGERGFTGTTYPELDSTREYLQQRISAVRQFLLDGTLAHILYHGGAYHNAQGDGSVEKRFALEVCDAMFGVRYGEISSYTNYGQWIPWFKGIAWDLTLVVFDRRTRRIRTSSNRKTNIA